jgi:hypothetical protein
LALLTQVQHFLRRRRGIFCRESLMRQGFTRLEGRYSGESP